MRIISTALLFVAIIVEVIPDGISTGPGTRIGAHRRFEYKFSFKPPYLSQKDGSVPFFEYFGNAIASEESVRITPSLKSQKGLITGKLPITFDHWEVEIQFRVTGRGRVGADGLAFWYTSQKGSEGPVFGNLDKWNGLGIFFDSFDNDNKHNNPYIMAMVNDGNIAYDHQADGSTQQLAGCLRDFRNKPFPVKAKIEFYRNVLTVLFHNGMSNNDKDYEVCMRVENVVLPQNGYFAISAATGGLADDHDVLKFSVTSLHTLDVLPIYDQTKDAESKKFEMEFEEYQSKLKLQKDQWASEHPDQVKPSTNEWDNWFSDSDKELKQIYQGQSVMKDIINDLHRKMDEMIGRQEGVMSLMSGISSGQGVRGGDSNIPVVHDSIRRDEVNTMLANQRELVSAVRDIKNFVSDIHSKANQLLNRGSVQPIGTPDVHSIVNEMKDSLNIVKRDISSVSQKECPQVTSSCVSNTYFLIFMFIQLLVLISFLLYRDSRESQAKKFY